MRLVMLTPHAYHFFMKLPRRVREKFRQHGRAGGRARAARMSSDARKGVARRAAMSRWMRARFGASTFSELGLPGGDLVDAGLADLASGRMTAESLVVSIAGPRLRREGVPVATFHADAEDRLYRLLTKRSGDLAHARYSALLRLMSSFANACHARRLDRAQDAR